MRVVPLLFASLVPVSSEYPWRNNLWWYPQYLQWLPDLDSNNFINEWDIQESQFLHNRASRMLEQSWRHNIAQMRTVDLSIFPHYNPESLKSTQNSIQQGSKTLSNPHKNISGPISRCWFKLWSSIFRLSYLLMLYCTNVVDQWKQFLNGEFKAMNSLPP